MKSKLFFLILLICISNKLLCTFHVLVENKTDKNLQVYIYASSGAFCGADSQTLNVNAKSGAWSKAFSENCDVTLSSITDLATNHPITGLQANSVTCTTTDGCIFTITDTSIIKQNR